MKKILFLLFVVVFTSCKQEEISFIKTKNKVDWMQLNFDLNSNYYYIEYLNTEILTGIEQYKLFFNNSQIPELIRICKIADTYHEACAKNNVSANFKKIIPNNLGKKYECEFIYDGNNQSNISIIYRTKKEIMIGGFYRHEDHVLNSIYFETPNYKYVDLLTTNLTAFYEKANAEINKSQTVNKMLDNL